MGVDCSNCNCTNRENESILIIDNSEKYYNSKIEIKKDKVEVTKNKLEINLNIILNLKYFSSHFSIKIGF